MATAFHTPRLKSGAVESTASLWFPNEDPGVWTVVTREPDWRTFSIYRSLKSGATVVGNGSVNHSTINEISARSSERANFSKVILGISRLNGESVTANDGCRIVALAESTSAKNEST